MELIGGWRLKGEGTYFKEKLNENTHFMETRVQSNGHENASCESLRDSIVENMMKWKWLKIAFFLPSLGLVKLCMHLLFLAFEFKSGISF